MTSTRTCLFAVSVCCAVACLPASAQRAPAPGYLAGGSNDIVTLERALGEAKSATVSLHNTLQSIVGRVPESAERWSKTARDESNPALQSVFYEFRDAEMAHAERIAKIGDTLHDLGELGGRIDTDEKVLRVVLSSLEQAARGTVPASKLPALFSDARQGLDLLPKEAFSSATLLLDAKTKLAAHTAALIEQNRSLQQTLAAFGSPQDRVRQYQKALVQTRLDENKTEAASVKAIAEIGILLSDVVTTFGSAIKNLQLAIPPP